MFSMPLVCFLSFKIPTSIQYYLSNAFSFHKSKRYAVLVRKCKVLYKSLHCCIYWCCGLLTTEERRLAYKPYALFLLASDCLVSGLIKNALEAVNCANIIIELIDNYLKEQ